MHGTVAAPRERRRPGAWRNRVDADEIEIRDAAPLKSSVEVGMPFNEALDLFVFLRQKRRLQTVEPFPDANVGAGEGDHGLEGRLGCWVEDDEFRLADEGITGRPSSEQLLGRLEELNRHVAHPRLHVPRLGDDRYRLAYLVLR